MQIKLHEWHLGMTRHIPTLPAMFVDVLDTPPRSLPDHRMNITDDHEGSADVFAERPKRGARGGKTSGADLGRDGVLPIGAPDDRELAPVVERGRGKVLVAAGVGLDEEVAAAFAVKAQRIAESLKLALFYRPDRPWPRTLP